MPRLVRACCLVVSLVAEFLCVLCVLTAPVTAQTVTGQVLQTAPLFLTPTSREPLLRMEAGLVVQVNRVEGVWVNVTVERSQFGPRTGYVESKYIRQVEILKASQREAAPSTPQPVVRVAPVAPAAAAVPVATVATVRPAGESSTPSSAANTVPRPVSNMTLRGVRRIFIEKMPNDLDQYISAEITKEFKGGLIVVLDKANADAIMRGISENRTGVGAAITGRYLGLHDNASASITLVDPAETVVLWASVAGDRSLLFGVMARGGQRKVADRLVNNLKDALKAAQ